MASAKDQKDHQELIIIRRPEEEEHESHSSAWKVAHADFMTAMMAFFLIMWLIKKRANIGTSANSASLSIMPSMETRWSMNQNTLAMARLPNRLSTLRPSRAQPSTVMKVERCATGAMSFMA